MLFKQGTPRDAKVVPPRDDMMQQLGNAMVHLHQEREIRCYGVSTKVVCYAAITQRCYGVSPPTEQARCAMVFPPEEEGAYRGAVFQLRHSSCSDQPCLEAPVAAAHL